MTEIVEEKAFELYVELKDWPGYWISTYGNVKSYKGGEFGVKVAFSQRAGYLRVKLLSLTPRKQQILSVHRLVLTTFIGSPPTDKHQVNHKDSNRTNNNISNLEWVTPSQNCCHGYLQGKRVGWSNNVGETHWLAKLTNAQVLEIRSLAGKMTQREIAARYGVRDSCINRIILRKRRADI